MPKRKDFSLPGSMSASRRAATKMILLHGVVDVALGHAQPAQEAPEGSHVLAHHLPQARLDVARAIRARAGDEGCWEGEEAEQGVAALGANLAQYMAPRGQVDHQNVAPAVTLA